MKNLANSVFVIFIHFLQSPGSRDCGSSLLKSVNKSTSQFKKSLIRRSGSSNDWFPRKKTESYLKRKIKRLQVLNGYHKMFR